MGDAHVLSVDARKLMRRIVAECLKAQGLPSHRQSVSAAIELTRIIREGLVRLA
jgi:hypothetical protein